MNNVKSLRKRNAEFLAQLKIDQIFYDIKLEEYDEVGLRDRSTAIQKDMTEEKARIDDKVKPGKHSNDKTGKQPTAEEMKVYLQLQTQLKEIQAKIDEFEEMKTAKTTGLKALDNVVKILMVIDKLPSKSRYELNHL